MLVALLGLACSYLCFVKLHDLKWITVPFAVPEKPWYKKEKGSFQVNFTKRTSFNNIN